MRLSILIESALSGEYAIIVMSRGCVVENRTVRLEKDSTLELDFGLVVGTTDGTSPTEVSGIVRQQGNSPLASANVAIENVFSRSSIYKAKTDKSGRYKIEVLHPAQYIIHAVKPGFAVNASAVIVSGTLPRQNKTVNIMLSPFKFP